jgi:phosphatidylinositol alpha-1,6-mannosyltransferase
VTYAHGEEILVARSSHQLKLIAQRVYRASDLVVANSENTRRLVLDLCPMAQVACIHPGVDVATFSPPPDVVAAFREQWRWPREAVIVCTLARMEPRKNHAAVIRAVAALRSKGLDAAYVCGGDGPERGALNQLVDSLNLHHRVRFTGKLPDRQRPLLYAASDIHALPAIQVGEMIEGFGIVFLEAAAAGIPSVCGNSGGQPEAVLNGQTGLVVDGSNTEAVTEAVERLCVDSGLRGQMRDHARCWAGQHDWSKVAMETNLAIDRATSG